MNELDIYKQNEINKLKIAYNKKVSILNSVLVSNIKNVQRQRISISTKKSQIKNFSQINRFKINKLTTQLNISIQKIMNFIPEFTGNETYTNKRALLIGINYIGTQYQLNGCIRDAYNMKDKLTSYGFTDFTILSEQDQIIPTRTNILTSIENFIKNSSSNDLLFFYFSGHGSYIRDINGDEIDGNDECIISSDLEYVTDDEIKQIITTYLKSDRTLIGMFDSCHSGTMFDLKYEYDIINTKYIENKKNTQCLGNVLMISGCRDNQTSAEAYINGQTQGALTWCFMETLKQTPNITWRELIKNMRQLLLNSRFSQIPQLSTDSIFNLDNKIFL
jgi:hypothetical protein